MEQDKRYYIYSHKHTSGWNRTFYRPNHSGYTINLEEAGIYTEADYEKDKKYNPIITSRAMLNYLTRKNIAHNAYDTFYIPVDRVFEILGKKMVCVLN